MSTPTIPDVPTTPSTIPGSDSPIVANTAALARISYKPGSADAQPCNWDLKPAGENADGEELVEGYNNTTGSTFSGTRTEFSAAIRGE